MNLQALKYFVAIAKKRNITAVAEELYVSQSALSRQIQMLETELGVKLFHRVKPNLVLTEDGRFLLEKIESIVQQVDDLSQYASLRAQGHYGTVRIGFSGSLEMEPLLRFASAAAIFFPNCSFSFHEEHVAALQRDLKKGVYDLVFAPLNGMHEDPELDTFVIGEPLMAAALSENHPLADRDSISLNDLREESFVVITRPDAKVLHTYLLQECTAAGFSPRQVYEVSTMLEAMLMIASNQAVALVGKNIQEFYPFGLKYVNVTDLQLHHASVGVAWRKAGLTPLLQAILTTIC